MSEPLKIYTHAEIVSLDIPPREYLLGGWLAERQPCMVYAQTGRGKSLFSMSLAIAIAGGGEVFGWKAPTPQTVLYVDAEMDLADIQDRARLLTPAIENLNITALNKNLKIMPRHGQSNDSSFPDIIEKEGQELVLALVEKYKPAIVILDNLSTLADLKDENDAASFTPILRLLWDLRNADCAVILVHHTGKKEGRFRGSSKLAATFESILQLAANDELVTGDTGFALKVDKFRGANQPTPIKVKLEVDEKRNGCWLYEGTGLRDLEILLTAVRSLEFKHAKDMTEHLGISAGEISKRKRKAISLGLITSDEWEQCFQDARDTHREFKSKDLNPKTPNPNDPMDVLASELMGSSYVGYNEEDGNDDF